MKTIKLNIEDVEIPITEFIIPKKKFYIVFTLDSIECEWLEWPTVHTSRNKAMKAVEYCNEDECRVIEIELPTIRGNRK